jgi:hypothetical protein
MSEEILNKLFNTQNHNYVFIYTPPKVGSTTLVSSLRISLGNTFNVIHIHDDIMLSVLTGVNNVTVNQIINYISKKGKNVYVIDVYRTPIERKMSEYFEKLGPYHFNNSEENLNKYSIKRIADRFNKLFPHLGNGDHYFDKFDIANPTHFDFDKKYTIQILNNIKYIKLRLCDSKIWASILSSIFQKEVVLINDYQTTNKSVGELYKRFKDEYKIPTNYLELVKDCRYFNFYFSDEERKQYIKVWENKTVNEFTPYSSDEYKFYVNLYLENQYINDIQTEHYIDNGCLCVYCTKTRKHIFNCAKNGETQFEKIIHQETVLKHQTDVAKSIFNKASNSLMTISILSVPMPVERTVILFPLKTPV